MRGLQIFVLISFIIALISGLLLIFFPEQMAQAKLGPQDPPSARYMAVTFLAFATAGLYAFRNPRKNVAVVRSLIVLFVLYLLVGLYNGITGSEQWDTALGSIILGVVMAAGLGYFYPRGEKAT